MLGLLSVKHRLAIVGPTASGKSALALELARRLNGEIISADSRQIYRYLNIGTAKASPDDRDAVPHHCIDLLEPNEEMSAGIFAKLARRIAGEIHARGCLPILAGGSGLYVRAMIDGLFDGPPAIPHMRKNLEDRLQAQGIDGLLKELTSVDPETAERMRKEPKARRIQRALEVYYATGVPLSKHYQRQEKGEGITWVQIGLEWSRRELYARIDDRVDRMMNEGFLDEVRGLMKRGFSRATNSLNTVGYKELIDHLEGRIDLSSAINLIKRNTRRFAKRQSTWFRGDQRIRWMNVDATMSCEDMADLAERVWEGEVSAGEAGERKGEEGRRRG